MRFSGSENPSDFLGIFFFVGREKIGRKSADFLGRKFQKILADFLGKSEVSTGFSAKIDINVDFGASYPRQIDLVNLARIGLPKSALTGRFPGILGALGA